MLDVEVSGLGGFRVLGLELPGPYCFSHLYCCRRKFCTTTSTQTMAVDVFQVFVCEGLPPSTIKPKPSTLVNLPEDKPRP